MTYPHNCFDLDRRLYDARCDLLEGKTVDFKRAIALLEETRDQSDLEAENEELEKRVGELEDELDRKFDRALVQKALGALLEIDTLAAQEHTDESDLIEILRIAQDAARALQRALD